MLLMFVVDPRCIVFSATTGRHGGVSQLKRCRDSLERCRDSLKRCRDSLERLTRVGAPSRRCPEQAHQHQHEAVR
jgi:hypothetical protein